MSYTCQILRAGTMRLDGGGMFGVVPKSLWGPMTDVDEHNRIGLQTNCLLLTDGARRVLIETGFGDKWSDRERGFYDLERRTVWDALAEIGVEPETIDHVIVTHLHFDHAAGLTRQEPGEQPIPTFPNAEVVVQRQEWEDARANRSTMTPTYLASHLDPIADRVRLIDGEEEVLPGLRVWPMPGHTWGQQAVRFDDGEHTVAFVGDVLPTINHSGPAFSLGYDMLPYRNMLSKMQLLEEAAAGDWRIILDHEPGPPVVAVEADPERSGRFRLRTLI